MTGPRIPDELEQKALGFMGVQKPERVERLLKQLAEPADGRGP